ncbi:hypothetical protein DINM_001333 [Dirofilaria immitis]|nr:hypothetical protein [Dirofilaria immitis]
MTNSTNLYVLLGGVERFGRMNPRLLYKEHLKDRDRNSSCKRYGVVAQWPELTDNGTVSKRWVTLLACKRDIHMEVMKNISSVIFMQAFRKYISRRLPCPEVPVVRQCQQRRSSF